MDRIRELSEISIIAHPGIYSNLSKTENISQLDLDGLAVFHPDHSTAQIQYYLNYANKNKLLVTAALVIMDGLIKFQLAYLVLMYII